MQANAAPPSTPSLPQLWVTMLLSTLVFSGLLVAVVLILNPEPVAPGWRDYTLAAIGVAVLPSIPALHAFRTRLAQAWRLDAAERTRSLQPRLMLGLAFADLPVLAGFLHAYVTGERWPLIAACAVTLVIVARYRPDSARPM